MTDEEIVVLLTQHSEQIRSLNNRSASLWERAEALLELVATIKEMSLSMQNMRNAQDRIFKRLEELESQPAKNWKTVTKTAMTAIVSAVAGAMAVGIVAMIANYMK